MALRFLPGAGIVTRGLKALAVSNASDFKNASTSWDSAVAEAISEVAAATRIDDDASRLVGGGAVVFDRGDSDLIELSAPPVIPEDTNIFFGSLNPAAGMVRVRMTSGAVGDVAFTVPEGFGSVCFQGITFEGCRVEFESDSRGRKVFNLCTWDSTTGPALKTLGTGVTNVKVVDGVFNRCAGAIDVQHTACDFWYLIDSKVVRSSAVGVLYNSSTFVMERGGFENKFDATALTTPDMKFEFGNIKVNGVRFGNDKGTGGGPATQRIQFGPDTPTTGRIPNVELTNNDFYTGSSGASGPVTNAILLNQALSYARIMGNHFYAHDGDIVEEAALSTSLDSYWVANPVQATHANGIFSSGASPTGWTIL